MALRITQLPEMASLHDNDVMIVVNVADGVTQKATIANIRSSFIVTAQNSAVGTTSPVFQLALPDASGLQPPLGGVRLTTGSFGSLILRNGADSDYTDLIGANGIFMGRLGVSLLGPTAPTNFTAQFGGDIGPDAGSTFNIGSAGIPWLHVYADSGSFGYANIGKADISNFTITNLSLQPGSAANPALAFTTDGFTGIYLANPGPTGGTFGIAADGYVAGTFALGSTYIYGAITASGASITGNAVITGQLTSSNSRVNGDAFVTGQLTANAKSFLIDHPTKPGMKLQYGSLEGPEHSVFIRGKLVDTSIIFLPDYWKKLVNIDTITVQLTPIGKYQKLYVKDVTEEYIIIKNDAVWDDNVTCFYTIYAERKDIPKLKTEF